MQKTCNETPALLKLCSNGRYRILGSDGRDISGPNGSAWYVTAQQIADALKSASPRDTASEYGFG